MKKPDLSYAGKMRKLFNYTSSSSRSSSSSTGINNKASEPRRAVFLFPWTQVWNNTGAKPPSVDSCEEKKGGTDASPSLPLKAFVRRPK